MNPVSIGVIGAGLFGRKHIDTIRPEPLCNLVAIADPTPEAAAYAAGIGVPCYANYTEMLDRVRRSAAPTLLPSDPARRGAADHRRRRHQDAGGRTGDSGSGADGSRGQVELSGSLFGQREQARALRLFSHCNLADTP
jgi:hypothetical protein